MVSEREKRELERLASHLQDNTLQADQQLRLNELLQSRDLQIEFIELCKLEYCLSRHVSSKDAVQTAVASYEFFERAAQEEDGKSPSLATEWRQSSKQKGERWSLTPWFVALAASLLLMAGFFWTQPSEDSNTTAVVDPPQQNYPSEAGISSAGQGEEPQIEPANTFPARIAAMSRQVAWGEDQCPSDYLLRLRSGERVRLSQGNVRMEVGNEAIVIAEGPAEWEIQDEQTVVLYSGVMTGRSEEGNLRILTNQAEVIDVGTAFRVSVEDARATHVSVLEGEVHVRRPKETTNQVVLTAGMAAHIDDISISPAMASPLPETPSVVQERPEGMPPGDISLVDIVCGSAPEEYRLAGAIDPETGRWDQLPWSEREGVIRKEATGMSRAVEWNPWVHCIFIPNADSRTVQVDLAGTSVAVPPLVGGAWGPVWARRRLEPAQDPLTDRLRAKGDVEGFWGEGTTTALLDRSAWAEDGLIGMHANVGFTIDLQQIHARWNLPLLAAKGTLALLEESHVSRPFHPNARANFQMFVDGELRYEQLNYTRQQSDMPFRVELQESDRFLSFLVTDGGDGPIYDRFILIDAALQTDRD